MYESFPFFDSTSARDELDICHVSKPLKQSPTLPRRSHIASYRHASISRINLIIPPRNISSLMWLMRESSEAARSTHLSFVFRNWLHRSYPHLVPWSWSTGYVRV